MGIGLCLGKNKTQGQNSKKKKEEEEKKKHVKA